LEPQREIPRTFDLYEYTSFQHAKLLIDQNSYFYPGFTFCTAFILDRESGILIWVLGGGDHPEFYQKNSSDLLT